jgi:hypothetical protein
MSPLSDDVLGVNVTILLDGLDVGIGPQDFQVSIGEGSSEAVDDVPFVGNLRLGADPVGDGGNTSKTVNVVLEGQNVTSGNSILGLLDSDEGRGSSESR